MKQFVCALFFISSILFASDRGKLIGTLKDKTTNEPIVGANIQILGTTLGAVSDINGFFFINNIPPNFYSIKISCIGYKNIEIKNFRISSDITSKVNLYLAPTEIQLDEEIIITAERPLLQKDRTSMQTVFEGDLISKELRINSISEILSLQAGVTKSADGSLHIRGGRTGGIVYQIDGIPTVNPFDRNFTGFLEANRVEELQTHLGTFDAEFGNASDGVVSIISKDGGENYKIKFQFESSQLNPSPYHQKDWNLNRSEIKNLSNINSFKDELRKPDGTSAYDFVSVLNDKYAKKYLLLPTLGNIYFSISGPIIPSLTFFSTSRFLNEDSPLPFGYNLFRSSTTKLTYHFDSKTSIRFSYDWSQNFGQKYDHQYKYWRWFDSKLDPLGRSGSYPIQKKFTNKQLIQFKKVLNQNTFYDFSFSRIYQNETIDVPDRTIIYNSNNGELIFSNYKKRYYVGGIDGSFRYGDVRYYTKINSTQYILKGNLESQLNLQNQFRSGFEIKNHSIFRHRIGMEPLPNLQYFSEHPIETSIFAQDKIELDFMILKIGLRLDYFDVATDGFKNPAEILEIITLNDGTTNYSTKQKSKIAPMLQLSPRFGIAHPISEKTSIHFAYGHFFQIPTFYDLYRNDDLRDILVNDALIGNPTLKPEKTVSYELGLQHQFTENWILNLTAYSKDISNLTSSFYYFVGRDYTIFTNNDFGRVQGIDLSLEKRFSNFYNFKFNYTLLFALGNQSDPSEGYTSYREDQAHLRPNRNYFLDFDQRHKINLLLITKFPEDFGITVFDVNPFENISSAIIFSIGSGLPYTPTSREAEESNINPEPNSARKPWINSLDVKVSKDFIFNDKVFSFYCDVVNLFDTENIISVWTRTGEALNQGESSIYSKDFQADPENLAPRREIKIGFILEF